MRGWYVLSLLALRIAGDGLTCECVGGLYESNCARTEYCNNVALGVVPMRCDNPNTSVTCWNICSIPQRCRLTHSKSGVFHFVRFTVGFPMHRSRHVRIPVQCDQSPTSDQSAFCSSQRLESSSNLLDRLPVIDHDAKRLQRLWPRSTIVSARCSIVCRNVLVAPAPD